MGGSGSNRNPDEDRPSASSSLPEGTEHSAPGLVLIIEDNATDVFLIRDALKRTGMAFDFEVARDGEQAMRFFDMVDEARNAPWPALVILDINLPRKPGYEVLKYMRKSAKCRAARVIAVSTSPSAPDREQMASLGADGYFPKPSEYADFMKLGALVKAILGGARP
jgi:chemotaxis family two-component system response regulator Rcp1